MNTTIQTDPADISYFAVLDDTFEQTPGVVINTSGATTNIPDNASGFTIYSTGNQIIIRQDDVLQCEMKVYSLNGEMLLQKDFSDQYNSIPVSLRAGMYVVMVTNAGGIFSEKVVIN